MENKFLIAIVMFGISAVLTTGQNSEAKEFSNRQFWSTPAIRYTNPKDDCLKAVHGWAENNVRTDCKSNFNYEQAYVSLCDAADVSYNDSDVTDKYGSECSTTATISVNEPVNNRR